MIFPSLRLPRQSSAKAGLPVFLLLGLLVLALAAGCQSWPRDAYIQGAKSTVNTPWGPMTQEADILATGTAAKNISLPELPAPAPGKK